MSNPASIDSHFPHRRGHRDTRLTSGSRYFRPPHGYRADVQDNMIETGHANDPTRGVPVYSLYSETREPTAEMLKGLDVLVIDLQDVGSRIYTFVYTMANCLRASRKHGVPVIVTDRPNPIGGERIDGPMLVEGFESFVGQSIRTHGRRSASARLFHEAWASADLTVWPMEHWHDGCTTRHGLTGVAVSEHSPSRPRCVSGHVLCEARYSEGRGTTRPFELIGAPWVDAEALAEKLATYALPGVHFRPVVFEPTFQKHAKRTCGGCQIHVLDRALFPAVETAIALLVEIRAQNPASFEWRQPPYEYEHTKLPIDILAGSSELRQQIEAGQPVRRISRAGCAPRGFPHLQRALLLY